MIKKIIAIIAFWVFAGLIGLAASSPAYAACTSPAEPEGTQIYDSVAKIMKYCDGNNWISMKQSNAVAISEARVSSGNTAAGGVFPTTWDYSTGSLESDVSDGTTTANSGPDFQNEICAVKFPFTAQVTSIILYANDGGDGIDLRRGYSSNGVDWTVIDATDYSGNSGAVIPFNNVVAKYIGLVTADATNSCDEIVITATQAAGGSAGSVIDDDSDTQIQVEEAADDDTIRFDTAGTERMVIDDTGAVGIGTDSPASLLDVAGGVRLGDDAGVCTPVKEGTLRFNAGTVQVCTQNSWVDISLVTGGDDGYEQDPPVTQSENLPEAITCSNGSDTRVFYLQYEHQTNDEYYYREKNNGYFLTYNKDTNKSYRNTNYASSNCAFVDMDDLPDSQKHDFDTGTPGQMFSGWPDMIMCLYSNYERHMYLSYIDASRYRYYARDGYYQDFLPADGTYVTQNLATSCSSQSIADLTASNDVYNFVGGDGSTSIWQDFPDAIYCEDTSGQQHLLFLEWNYTNTNTITYSTTYSSTYYQFYKHNGFYRTDNFNGSCRNKTLAQLKELGLTANFAEGGQTASPPSTDESIVEGWPDVILCQNGLTNYALRMGHYSGVNRYYYSFHNSYYMYFNTETKAYGAQHAAIAGTDCNAKSIADLVSGGQTVTFKDSGAETSIVPGWPDAIVCNDAGGRDFYFQYGYSDGTTVRYYRWYGASATTYAIHFAVADGSNTYDYEGSECSGKSIATLTSEGKTFNMVAGIDNGSQMDGWPDLIICMDDGIEHPYWLTQHQFGSEVYYVNTAGYYYQYEPETQSYETDNNNSIGCRNKSISQLVSEGNAYWFVETGNESEIQDGYVSGGTSMVDGWPDAVVCTRYPDGSKFVYWLEYRTTTSVRYKSYYSSTYVQFLPDGNWSTYAGATTDCLNRSIQELKSYGQTFDLAGGTGSVSALFDNDGDTKIQLEAFSDEDQIRLSTAGAERLIIDNTGNIGVGTATPGSTLHVAGTTTTTSLIIGGVSGLTAPSASTQDYWTQSGSNVYYTSGNVGVGTASPVGNLDVVSLDPLLYLKDSNAPTTRNITGLVGGGAFRIQTRQDDGSFVANNYLMNVDDSGAIEHIWRISNAERMRIHSNGNVGIGTASPSARLDVSGAGFNGGRATFQSTDSGNGILVKGVDTPSMNDTAFIQFDDGGDLNFIGLTGTNQVAGDLRMYVGGAERMRLTDSGNIGIGTISPGYKLEVNGTAGKTGGGSWSNSSDIRLKDVTGAYAFGLNEIVALDAIRFNYKADNARGLPSDTGQIGFVAQDVQKVIPDAVTEGEDGFLDFNMHAVNVALVNAVKELKILFDDLLAKVTGHDAAIEALRAENEALKAENKIILKRLEALEQKFEVE